MKGIPQGRYTKEFREEAVKLVTEGKMTIPYDHLAIARGGRTVSTFLAMCKLHVVFRIDL